jgi:hypothetical protein
VWFRLWLGGRERRHVGWRHAERNVSNLSTVPLLHGREVVPGAHTSLFATPTHGSQASWRAPFSSAMIPAMRGSDECAHNAACPLREACGATGGECSAYANISLALSLSYAERLPLLLHYARWFASVTFLVADRRGSCEACHEQLRQARANESAWLAAPTSCFCAAMANVTSETQAERSAVSAEFVVSANVAVHQDALRVARAMRHALHAAPSRRRAGVLFLHMDMWFNVRAPLPAPANALWSPLRGMNAPCSLAPSCHDVTDPKWRVDREAAPDRCPWYHEARPNCRRAVLALGGSTCCMGWSDLVYVPAAQLDRFVEVNRVLRAHQVHHEAAAITALAVVSREARVPWQTFPCLGSCCSTLVSAGWVTACAPAAPDGQRQTGGQQDGTGHGRGAHANARPPLTAAFGLPLYATSPRHAILPVNTTVPLSAALPLHATAATCAHRMMLSSAKVRAVANLNPKLKSNLCP